MPRGTRWPDRAPFGDRPRGIRRFGATDNRTGLRSLLPIPPVLRRRPRIVPVLRHRRYRRFRNRTRFFRLWDKATCNRRSKAPPPRASLALRPEHRAGWAAISRGFGLVTSEGP